MLIKPISFNLRQFKKGDIIMSDDQVGIFSSLGHHPDGGSCNDRSYFYVEGWCWLDPEDYFTTDGIIINYGNARLAKKSERDLLLKKMKEAGYFINPVTKSIEYV